MRAGESYVVIGTIKYPNGALRAQLMPQPVRLDQAPASLAPTQAPVVEPQDPTPFPEPEEED